MAWAGRAAAGPRPHDSGESSLAVEERIGGLTRPRVVDAVRGHVPDGAASVAKALFHVVGRATSALRPLPDFLVIGTKKGGTTSLMDWLIEHQDVARLFPPVQRRKSPHYFDLNYWRGDAWYRSHFQSALASRAAERRRGTRPILGEASPYYMFHPAAASRAHAVIPHARVIAVLRDPVSRAYSHYWDRVATGHEDLPTFEAAIDAEVERLAGLRDEMFDDPRFYSFDHDHHSYLARGRYLEQLQRWTARYPVDRVMVLSAGDLSTRPQETFDEVQRFLGLAPAKVPLVERNARTYPPMAPQTRDRLQEYFAPHNRALYDALGRDLGW